MSDAVAIELASRGVGSGNFVPVVLARGPLLVSVLLGVMKTGAAYCVLDPGWPGARLEAAVAQLPSPVLISDAAVIEGAAAWDPTPTAVVAPHRLTKAPEDTTVGADPCAVFFTSGTTGQPRGAVVPHAGTVELFEDCSFAVLGPGAVMLQAAALPWDMLSLELWGMLVSGGTCLLPSAPAVTGRVIRESIASGTTLVFLTSSLFNLFVDEDPDCFTGIGQVIVGGERLSPTHVERFLATHPTARLTNLYGPVEAPILITTHDISPGESAGPWGVPVGRGAPGLELQVLTDRGQAAEGEIGELHISGPRLALGYLGMPEHPAFREFEVDGHRHRWYATGDLVAHRDGLLYFAGRRDRQVKVRGHRVEPAEVEAIMSVVPGVASCRVVPVPGDHGIEGIAAFWTAAPVDVEDVEHLLRQRITTELPPYARPRVVVRVDELPITANGKLDERALLDSVTTPVVTAAAPDGPFATAVHQEVRDVLGLASVPDGFTLAEMGASSLERARLAMRLEHRLGGVVRVVDLDDAANVGDLVARLLERPDPPRGEPTDPTTGEADLSPLQSSIAFISTTQPDDVSVLCPVMWALTADGGSVPPPAVVRAALQDVQDRHEALRSRYLLTERPAAVPLSPHEAPAVELLEVAPSSTGHPEQELLTAMTSTPLDLTEAHAWRAAITSEGTSATTLLGVVVNHIAWDGWSEAVFAHDLGVALAAHTAGENPCFSTAAPTLASLARRRALRGGRSNDPEQVRDWVDHLAGAPLLEFEGPASPCQGPCRLGEHVHREVTAGGAVAPWRELARASGCSVFPVMVAIFDEALRPLLRRQGIVAAVAASSRDGSVEEDALGCVVDVRCVRLPAASPGADWDQRVRAAHDEVRLMQAHATIPFTDLVGLVPPPPAGRTPLFQVMFNWQDNIPSDLRIAGCQVLPVRVEPPRAETELVVNLWPTAKDGVEVVVTNRCEQVADESARQVAYRLKELVEAGPT